MSQPLLGPTVIAAPSVRVARRLVALATLAAACAACARQPAAARPTPQPSQTRAAAPAPAPAIEAAPDLAGRWLYDATLASAVITGTITLVRSGDSYTGSATASTADEPVAMTSMSVAGTGVVMIFDTPDGAVRVEGTVTGGTVINATVTFNDQTGTLRARRQP